MAQRHRGVAGDERGNERVGERLPRQRGMHLGG